MLTFIGCRMKFLALQHLLGETKDLFKGATALIGTDSSQCTLYLFLCIYDPIKRDVNFSKEGRVFNFE